MPLRLVRQDNYMGCFVAAVATMIGASYADARKMIHPNKGESHGIAPEKAIERLRRLGFNPQVRYGRRRVRDLRENTLLLVTWSHSPELGHTVVWDAEERKVLDPCGWSTMTHGDIERQLYCSIALKAIRSGQKAA